jgi:hypothetical protein
VVAFCYWLVLAREYLGTSEFARIKEVSMALFFAFLVALSSGAAFHATPGAGIVQPVDSTGGMDGG